MIESRNKTVPTYREEILEEEYEAIVSSYYPALTQLAEKMKTLL